MFKKSVLFMALCISPVVFAEDQAPPKQDKPAATDNSKYPLKTCIVSGDDLEGDMGKPIEIQYKGRTVMLCCKGCVPKFNKEPEKYIKILDEAEAKAKQDATAPKK